MKKLTKNQKTELRKDGMRLVEQFETKDGEIMVIAQNDNGTFHGVWRDGESYRDIRWQEGDLFGAVQ